MCIQKKGERIMKPIPKKTKEPTPIGGLTYEQIGRNLGITKQGVRRIERRAFLKIKKILKRRYGIEVNNIRNILLKGEVED